MRGAERRVRRDFSHTGERAINTRAASGDLPPHGHDPAWTSWLPVPLGRRTPQQERRAEYCCLMTGQENERGAPYFNFGTKCPNVEKGERATPARVPPFHVSPSDNGERLALCFDTAKGGCYG